MEERPQTANLARSRPALAHRVEPRDFVPVRAPRDPRRRAEDMHICPQCESHLVLPTDWAPALRERWLVELRCPDCEWTGRGTYPQRVVDRFDEKLDEGTEALLEDLSTLARANMEELAESFIAGIWAEQILPEDF